MSENLTIAKIAEIASKDENRVVELKQPIAPHKTDGTLNDTLNDTLKSDIEQILQIIDEHPGIQIKGIMQLTNKSRSTINRYITSLLTFSKIERCGSRKTGGYYKL